MADRLEVQESPKENPGSKQPESGQFGRLSLADVRALNTRDKTTGTDSAEQPPLKLIDSAKEPAKSGEEIGKSWTDAQAKGDFTAVNKEMEKAIKQAFAGGGKPSVNELDQKLSDNTPSGMGPILVKDGDKIIVHNAVQFVKDEAAKFDQMTPAEREKAGVYKLADKQGWLKDIAPSVTVDVPAKAQDLKAVDKLAEQYGKGLDATQQGHLKEALKYAVTGDAGSLKEMVYNGPKAMDWNTQEAFKKSLESVGFKVQPGGSNEKMADGARSGDLIIVPPESTEGVRLHYDKKRGPNGAEVSCAESVKVSTDGDRLRVLSESPKPEDVDKQMRTISQHISLDEISKAEAQAQAKIEVQNKAAEAHKKVVDHATEVMKQVEGSTPVDSPRLQTKSAEELGKMWTESLGKGNFETVNSEMQKAVTQAFSDGGLPAVRELEKKVNAITPDGVGPVLVQSGDRFVMHNASQVVGAEAEKTDKLSPEQRQKEGYYHLDGYNGWFKDLSKPTNCDVSIKSAAVLKPEDQKSIDKAATEFGKDLNADEQSRLKDALKNVACGNVEALKKFAPYADQSMDQDTVHAFTKALESVGMTVQMGGFAEKMGNGARVGEMIILPPGATEGLRVSYARPTGDNVAISSTADMVTVNRHGDRFEVINVSAKRSTIEKEMRAMSEDVRWGFANQVHLTPQLEAAGRN